MVGRSKQRWALGIVRTYRVPGRSISGAEETYMISKGMFFVHRSPNEINCS